MKHFLSRSPFHRSEKQQDNVCLPPPSSLPPPRAPSPPPSYNTATPIAPHTGSSAPPLTVVELFQSQGCSSCPPANANVLALAAAPDTLVLTYEVTYWDYLGWPDTFARKEWDVRQREYASAMKSNRVYTPQVIVNGSASGVGSRQKELLSLISQGQNAAPPLLTITPSHDTASITILPSPYSSQPPPTRAIVQLMYYDPHTHDVPIARGENRGRTLPHRNVVRAVVVLGWWEGGARALPLPEGNDTPEGVGGLLRAVVVQRGRGGAVVGAARV